MDASRRSQWALCRHQQADLVPVLAAVKILRRDTPLLGRTHGRHCIPHRVHPENASSTPNQSRSAKPTGAIMSSPSPADFRTPTSARSNLHSLRQPSYPTSRAFLHWRLSDDGPGASRIIPIGRHPKPFTCADSCTAANSNAIRSTHRSGEDRLARFDGPPEDLTLSLALRSRSECRSRF
jgi:hypothetical protein